MDTDLQVLFVEDDAAYADLVQSALRETSPYRTVRAASWTEAEGLLERQDWLALILDLGLPESSRLSTLERALHVKPEVAVIVLSGQLDRATRLDALRAGAQEALAKEEFDLARLAERIEAAVARQTWYARAERGRREERARREAKERELAWFDDLVRTPTSAAGSSLGILPLSQASPPLFGELVAMYKTLLEDAVANALYQGRPPVAPRSRALADRLAAFRAGPREVTEIHTSALRKLMDREDEGLNKHFADEGRLVLIEVMGYLLAHYRTEAVGSRRSSSTDPSQRPGETT